MYAPTRLPSLGGPGGQFLVGSNANGESAPSYLRTAPCALPAYVTYAAAGYPHQCIVLIVSGSVPGCVGDISPDGVVNGADLGALLGNWGDTTGLLPGDFNEDGVIDGADLGLLLGAWGDC